VPQGTTLVAMDAPAQTMPASARPLTIARARWSAASLALVFGGYIVGRLVVLVAAVFSETLLIRNPTLTSGDGSFLLRALTSWDGWWYLGIARDGYHLAPIQGPYHDYAFLPLFPGLVRVLSSPFPGAEGLIAVLLSHALFAAALVLLFALGRRHLGDRRAAVACFLLGISPFSVMFSMAYGESLFLALSVGAFLAAERGHRPLAGILLALSAVTRLQGAVLAIPLWLVLFRADKWRLRPSQAWVLLGPLGVSAFLGWVAWFTGSAAAYAANQAEWGRGVIGSLDPSQTIAATFNPIQVALLLILCATIWPLVYARVDRIRVEYVAIPVLFVAATFVSGNLESIGRYATAAFPIFWLLAGRRSIFWRRGWPALSAGLLGIFSLLSFGGYWAP
jgi:hypothetical protein